MIDPFADLPHVHRTLASALWNTGSCYHMSHADCWAYVQRLYPDAQTLLDVSPANLRALITALLDCLDPEPGPEEAIGPGHSG